MQSRYYFIFVNMGFYAHSPPPGYQSADKTITQSIDISSGSLPQTQLNNTDNITTLLQTNLPVMNNYTRQILHSPSPQQPPPQPLNCQHFPTTFADPMASAIRELQAARQHITNAQDALMQVKQRPWEDLRSKELQYTIEDLEASLRQRTRRLRSMFRKFMKGVSW